MRAVQLLAVLQFRSTTFSVRLARSNTKQGSIQIRLVLPVWQHLIAVPAEESEHYATVWLDCLYSSETGGSLRAGTQRAHLGDAGWDQDRREGP